MVSCVKHLIVMETQLNFLRNNLKLQELNDDTKKNLVTFSNNITRRFKHLKHIAKLLKNQAVKVCTFFSIKLGQLHV